MTDPATFQEPADSESLAELLLPQLEATIQKALDSGVPLPQRMIAELRGEILKLSDLCRRACDISQEPGPEHQEPGIDPGVALLLLGDFARLRRQVGAERARQIYKNTLRVFTQPSKGRPRTIPLETIVAARRMKLKNESYAQIARKLYSNPSQIRSALRYYYPGE
jgi:hypothetical protein